MFNLELSPKCRPRGGVRSVRRPSPVRLRPAPPGFRRAWIQFGWPWIPRRPFSRFTTRFRPPVPLVCCSFRSWFVSPFRFQFSSVRFQLIRFVFVLASFSCSFSARFLFVSAYPVLLVLNLFCVRLVRVCFIYLFSRILYTIKSEKQMYFLPENMCFFENVSIFDVFFPKNVAFRSRFCVSRDDTRLHRKQGPFFHAPPDRSSGHGSHHVFPVPPDDACHR